MNKKEYNPKILREKYYPLVTSKIITQRPYEPKGIVLKSLREENPFSDKEGLIDMCWS